MALSIDWAPMAEVDLQTIGDRTVIAELLYIATTELPHDFLPPASEDQGTVRDSPRPGIAWRRGIKRDAAWSAHSGAPEDLSRIRACDYVLVYRLPEPSEFLSAGRTDGRKIDFVVVRVLPASDYARFMNHAIAEQALELGDLWTQLLRASERSI